MSAPPCAVPFHVPKENLSGGRKLLADESKAKHPTPECVGFVLRLLCLCACVLYFVGQFAHPKAKLNVGFNLSCVNAALLLVAVLVNVGVAELEESELDRSVSVEKAVKVEHVVAAVVVMLSPVVVRVVPFVPNVFEFLHRLRFLGVHHVEEVAVNRLAVVSGAPCVNPDRPSNLGFVRRHDVDQVLNFGAVESALAAYVNVYPCANRRIANRSCLAKGSEESLQGFNVIPTKDRGDQLALLCVRPFDANVPAELPLAAMRIPSAPSHVSVSCVGVSVVDRVSEKLCGKLRGILPGDVVHLNFYAEVVVVLDPVDLGCCVLHSLVLRFSGVFPRFLRTCYLCSRLL